MTCRCLNTQIPFPGHQSALVIINFTKCISISQHLFCRRSDLTKSGLGRSSLAFAWVTRRDHHHVNTKIGLPSNLAPSDVSIRCCCFSTQHNLCRIVIGGIREPESANTLHFDAFSSQNKSSVCVSACVRAFSLRYFICSPGSGFCRCSSASGPHTHRPCVFQQHTEHLQSHQDSHRTSVNKYTATAHQSICLKITSFINH